jgi:hypothetical protein
LGILTARKIDKQQKISKTQERARKKRARRTRVGQGEGVKRRELLLRAEKRKGFLNTKRKTVSAFTEQLSCFWDFWRWWQNLSPRQMLLSPLARCCDWPPVPDSASLKFKGLTRA